jgi:hypothetical protein
LRWEDGVDQDKRILGVKNWKKVTLDRDEWAKLLKKARAHQGAVKPMMMTFLRNVGTNLHNTVSEFSRFTSALNVHQNLKTHNNGLFFTSLEGFPTNMSAFQLHVASAGSLLNLCTSLYVSRAG